MRGFLAVVVIILLVALVSDAAYGQQRPYDLGRYLQVRPPRQARAAFGFGKSWKPPVAVHGGIELSNITFKDFKGKKLEFITWEKTHIAVGPCVGIDLRIRDPLFRGGFYVEGRARVNKRWYRLLACLIPDPKWGWIQVPPISNGCRWAVKPEEEY